MSVSRWVGRPFHTWREQYRAGLGRAKRCRGAAPWSASDTPSSLPSRHITAGGPKRRGRAGGGAVGSVAHSPIPCQSSPSSMNGVALGLEPPPFHWQGEGTTATWAPCNVGARKPCPFGAWILCALVAPPSKLVGLLPSWCPQVSWLVSCPRGAPKGGKDCKAHY